MIVLSDTGRDEAPQTTRIAESREPLSARSRRAVAAADAVDRGEIGLDEATRRYGVGAAVIEAWQHALATVRPSGRC